MGFSDLGSIGICIDEYNAGEMKGRIYSSMHEGADTFSSVITLVKTINSIFDEGDYPQATMRCRGFNKPGKTEKTQKKAEAASIADPTKVNFFGPNIKGKKATFGVKVMFRQNASWQGTLFWIEKNREESFRSVLEMMMLIDSAFEAEQAAGSDSDILTANM